MLLTFFVIISICFFLIKLLPAVEMRADGDLRLGRSGLPRQWRQRVGHMRQHIEQVAILRVDDPLHLAQLRTAKALFGQAIE